MIYSLTETETETETNIMSLNKTERETEMICKTETKYKRKSEHMKRNSNWNENDFKTKWLHEMLNIGHQESGTGITIRFNSNTINFCSHHPSTEEI